MGSPRNSQRQAAAQARRERFIAHARRVFASRGYAQTTIDELIRRGGGSKASLSKFFGGKAGLLAAVIERETREYLAGLPVPDARAGLEQSLESLCVALLRLFTLPQALMAYRAAVGEGHRDRRLAEAYYLSGRAQTVAAVAARLRRWQALGLVDSADAEADADRLTHLLRSGLHERILLGLAGHLPADRALRACARESARLFLHGVAARRPVSRPGPPARAGAGSPGARAPRRRRPAAKRA